MIEPRYRQQTLYEQAVENFMPDHKKLLWESWMLKVDELLEKDEWVEIVHKALQQRHPQSGTRGRKATPAEVVLRLLVLKHLKTGATRRWRRKGGQPGLPAIYAHWRRNGAGCQDDGAVGNRFGASGDPADS
jgi:IS5 family transposase